MREVDLGRFDAVISIFNAIGHLTKKDFKKALTAIKNNLNDNGLFIFDINNLNYLLEGDNITTLTIDWLQKKDNLVVRDIQYSAIDEDGVLASYTTHYKKEGDNAPVVSKSCQTLQIYSSNQLKEILENNGFKVLEQVALDGSKFLDKETSHILTVAQKV